MTTTDNKLERLSSDQLKQRIQLNQKARFGLETATPEQLNIIFLICRRLDLDPLEDITLMHGHPWYTVNGTFRMMRRHPEYAGFEQWPLTVDEKANGGWQKDDIVWATKIRTKAWGEIVQWGKVTQAEVDEALTAGTKTGRRPAPIALNPVEMAQKRSAQHAIRAAFGHEAAPNEQEIEQLLVEEIAIRNDPARIQANADKYDEIYAKEADPPPVTGPRPLPARPKVDRDAERLGVAWEHNRYLSAEAIARGMNPRVLRVDSSADEIEAQNRELEDALTTEEEESDGE